MKVCFGTIKLLTSPQKALQEVFVKGYLLILFLISFPCIGLSAQTIPYFSQNSSYYQSILASYPKKNNELPEALNFHLTYGKRSDTLEATLKKILENPKLAQREVLEKALELAYAFYPDSFYEEIIILKSQNISERAKLLSYLYYSRRMGTNDLVFDNTPLMLKLKSYLEGEKYPDPPLLDLFRHSFGNGKWVLFSIQTRSRDYPGILVVRKPDGKFLRDKSGSFFHFSQLGRAVTNLPYFLRNGHTPTGIYKIAGKVHSQNPAIGPTPALVLKMPGEVSKQEFLQHRGEWREQDILDLFPESWRFPEILGSYEAGHFGRGGIWMHGSTVDPSEFRENLYYPLTPAFGCLTSYEFWDKKLKNLYSSQASFWTALEKEKLGGYLIVVNRDRVGGIRLEDIMEDMILSESYSSL